MTVTDLLEYCLAKNGAYEEHPFGPEPTIVKVRGKIFAQLFAELHGKPSVTLNCTKEQGELYRMLYPGVIVRGYHCPPVMRPYFNTLPLDGSVPDEVVLQLADESYKAVVGKLPKYLQKELL